jgi:hypothetical protein
MNAYPFTVDSHACLVVDAQVLDFGDFPDAFHVGGITAGTKDDCDTCARVYIRRGDEGPGSVINDRSQLCRHILRGGEHHVNMILGRSERRETYPYMLVQALAEHLCDISALGVGRSETLCPANEFAMIDTFLSMNPKTGALGMPTGSVMTRRTSMGMRTRDVLRLDSQPL